MGHRGNAYAFENLNFDGRFAALNVGGGHNSAWWSYFGDTFNDRVSSSLVIAREPQTVEIEVPLRQLISPQFVSIFDAETAGTQLSRDGDPRVYGTFFPSDAEGRFFATVDQDLDVEINNWPDYNANVRYDIEFYLSNSGRLHGQAARSHVWVESGIFSGSVHDRIAPRLHAAKSRFTSAIEAQLGLFSNRSFSAAYLLPGPVPDMNKFGFFARHDDDVVLVVVDA